ncbi:MAG: cofactor-independent phosphoglycerate mutase [Candidatus Goldbacteria bacterium]|nr:cofactor-independent phosphoglycerate mutase [Candidatus Goldiibacteriota bacterium]
MKYIILLADGMADRPIAEIGNKTPLEAANKPNMDFIFRKSICGMVKPLCDGLPFGSDVGNLAILGYDPHKYYTGRAAMEAANLGIELKQNEVAFRCNLVYVKDGIMMDYSAGHITTKEAKELIKLIDNKLGSKDVKFYPGKSYRHIMVMKGGENIKAVAPHDIYGQEIEKHFPKGTKSSFLIQMMKDSQLLLEGHEINIQRRAEGKPPANMIWLWGQGKKLELPKLKDTYGMEGAVISAVDLVNGIGLCMGLEVINVPGVTGYIDTNFKGKVEYALRALKKKDFVYLHIEATDEMGHNGDIQGKIKAIELFDSEVVGPIFEGMKKFGNFKLMITSDHATPIEVRTHTDEPVPFFIYNSTKEVENPINILSEREIKKNSNIKFEKGWELFPFFIKN